MDVLGVRFRVKRNAVLLLEEWNWGLRGEERTEKERNALNGDLERE